MEIWGQPGPTRCVGLEGTKAWPRIRLCAPKSAVPPLLDELSLLLTPSGTARLGTGTLRHAWAPPPGGFWKPFSGGRGQQELFQQGIPKGSVPSPPRAPLPLGTRARLPHRTCPWCQLPRANLLPAAALCPTPRGGDRDRCSPQHWRDRHPPGSSHTGHHPSQTSVLGSHPSPKLPQSP